MSNPVKIVQFVMLVSFHISHFSGLRWRPCNLYVGDFFFFCCVCALVIYQLSLEKDLSLLFCSKTEEKDFLNSCKKHVKSNLISFGFAIKMGAESVWIFLSLSAFWTVGWTLQYSDFLIQLNAFSHAFLNVYHLNF